MGMGKGCGRKLKVCLGIEKFEIRIFDARKYLERKLAGRTPAAWGRARVTAGNYFCFFEMEKFEIRIFDVGKFWNRNCGARIPAA